MPPSWSASLTTSIRLLIADSGPLIALARLDLLALPGRFFDEVVVTPTVWMEVTRKPMRDETDRLEAAMSAGRLTLSTRSPADPSAAPDVLTRGGVDAGERSVILLALQTDATLLMDDRRARQAALALGLPVVGTLGLLTQARKLGMLMPLRPLLLHLRATGYYLPADAVALVLANLGE